MYSLLASLSNSVCLPIYLKSSGGKAIGNNGKRRTGRMLKGGTELASLSLSSVCLSSPLFSCPFLCLHVYLPFSTSFCLSPSFCLSTCFSVYFSVYLSSSSSMSTCHFVNLHKIFTCMTCLPVCFASLYDLPTLIADVPV